MQGLAVLVEDVKSRAAQTATKGRWPGMAAEALKRKEDIQCEWCRCSVECPDKPVFSLFLSNLPS
jgi:hypothetical protein